VLGLGGALEELERAGVLLMVTSRELVSARLSGPLKLTLESLDKGDAIRLLKERAGPMDITRSEAEQLVALCDCNALYITIIASLLSDIVTPEVSFHKQSLGTFIAVTCMLTSGPNCCPGGHPSCT
jgi:hypothetical protein